MKERRNHKRHKLDPQPRLFNFETREEIGSVIDITPQGMLITSAVDLPIGANLQILVVLEKKMFGKNSFEVEVRTVWTRPAHESPEHLYGVDFVNVSPHDTGMITALIISEIIE